MGLRTSLTTCCASTEVTGFRRVLIRTELVGKRVNASGLNDIAVLGWVAVSRYEPKDSVPYRATVETLFEMAL